MQRKLVAALLLSSAIFISAPAAADDGRPVTQLDAVVVTADRSASAKKEVTSNIMVIDNVTIENSAANDVGELLAELGFQTRNYPGTNTALGIRGYRTETHGNDLAGRVLLLLNGRRIGTGNASVLALANVERIEIIRGPAASQYGAAAMGGVVNVITRKGTADGSPFAANVEAGTGGFNSYKTVVNLAAQSNGFDAAFGYRYYKRDDYQDGNGDRYRNTRIKGNNTFNLDAGYTFLDIHRVGLNVNYFDSEAYSPGSKTATTFDKTDKSNYNVSFNYAGGTSGETFTWSANYAFGKDDRNYRTHRYSTGVFTDKSKYMADSSAGQTQISFNHKYVTITAGFDFVDYDLDDNGSKANYKNYAGFVLGKLRLFDEMLIISAGGRYDDFSVKGKTQNLSTNETRFSPSVGLAFSPVNWLKLRAHYAQGFIMPSPNYIFGDDRYYIPNLSLKPEKNETYEAGFDIGWNYLDFSFTYFYSIGKDALNATHLGNWVYQYTNLDKSIREGIEIEFSGDIARAIGFNAIEVRPYLNFTYMTTYKGRNTKNDPYTKLTYVPRQNIGYGIRFSYPEYNFTTTLSASYFGKEYRNATTQNDAFTVVNWTMRKQLLEFGEYGHLDIKAEVTNLFDKQYAYVDGYPSPGRSFYVGLNYTY